MPRPKKNVAQAPTVAKQKPGRKPGSTNAVIAPPTLLQEMVILLREAHDELLRCAREHNEADLAYFAGRLDGFLHNPELKIGMPAPKATAKLHAAVAPVIVSSPANSIPQVSQNSPAPALEEEEEEEGEEEGEEEEEEEEERNIGYDPERQRRVNSLFGGK